MSLADAEGADGGGGSSPAVVPRGGQGPSLTSARVAKERDDGPSGSTRPRVLVRAGGGGLDLVGEEEL